MSKRSKKFKDKIRACRGIVRTGGVVAAASMALVSKGYGVAIRYQVNDHIPPSTPQQGYDIDQDGDADVFFDTNEFFSARIEAERESYGGAVATVSGFVFLDPIGMYANGFELDEWVSEIGVSSSPIIESAWLNVGPDGEFYNQPAPRYAGFTFAGPDSLLHYGWAELRVTGSDLDGYGLDVIAFGYETDPLLTIQAGRPLVPVPTKPTTWGEIKSKFGK